MIAQFVEKHDRFVQRFLEILLGVMTWSLLTSPIWLGIIWPEAIVYLLTLLTVTWFYMAFKHSRGLVYAYKRYQKEIRQNWMDELNKLDYANLPDKETLPSSLNDVRHMIMVPAVNEPEDLLRESFDSIYTQTFPIKQLVLVYTVEEKYADQTIGRIRNIIGEREKDLHKLLIYVHPAGIPGEAIGDGGANRAWGSSHAVADLIKSGENIRNYIFDSFDSDHVLDPQYIARVTHLYLSTAKRDNHFYSSAVPLFDNNLWRVPFMMRIEANAVTLGIASDWGASEKSVKKTFSAFSTSLQTLIDAEYFNVQLGADDTIFFWRAFFARDGSFDGIPHFIPYSADAVEGKSYMDSHKSLYKQLLRWGWGAVDFPLSVKGFLKNSRVPLSRKLHWLLRHFKERVFLVNIVFLITFGFWLVTLVNPNVKQSNFAYSLPDIMSVILTVTLVFLIPGAFYRLKFVKPMPKEWSIFRKALVLLEGPLIILNLLTFSFIPGIDAQTRILFGKRIKDLYHTPKIR